MNCEPRQRYSQRSADAKPASPSAFSANQAGRTRRPITADKGDGCQQQNSNKRRMGKLLDKRPPLISFRRGVPPDFVNRSTKIGKGCCDGPASSTLTGAICCPSPANQKTHSNGGDPRNVSRLARHRGQPPGPRPSTLNQVRAPLPAPHHWPAALHHRIRIQVASLTANSFTAGHHRDPFGKERTTRQEIGIIRRSSRPARSGRHLDPPFISGEKRAPQIGDSSPPSSRSFS